ncbi:MAG TPA: amidase family protein, partial [Nitrospinaceae bacterium]|nr:amidase family protein [Nitrospinaceae bacterium]
MHSKTILQAKEDLQQKKYSAVELTEAIYQRIDSVEPKVQAFVHLTRDIALKQAQEADRKLAAGQNAPLPGIPIALK